MPDQHGDGPPTSAAQRLSSDALRASGATARVGRGPAAMPRRPGRCSQARTRTMRPRESGIPGSHRVPSPGEEVRVVPESALQALVPRVQRVCRYEQLVATHVLHAAKALHEVEQVHAHALGKVLARAQLAALLLLRLGWWGARGESGERGGGV